MVTLRPTRKLRTALPVAESAAISDTALGDWYVNRLLVDRQPLLLLVSSASLLPIVVRARDVRALPRHIGDMVARRLARRTPDGGVSSTIGAFARDTMSCDGGDAWDVLT